MGFRTVVMLSNDHAHEWSNDPELGRKISRDSIRSGESALGQYGDVIECVHGDTQTLAVLDGYTSFKCLASKSWARGESENEVAVRLLKEAADQLGFRLVKKSAK